MNTHESWSISVLTGPVSSPQHVGFQNTVFVDLEDMTRQFTKDQNGIVTYLGMDSLTSRFEFKPLCLCRRHISPHLREFVTDSQIRRILSKRIARVCASLPEPFSLTFYTSVTREVQITVRSKAAPRDVFQRLFEEQRMELADLERVEDKDCSICMEDLSEISRYENIICMPNCSHLFHRGCIFKWLKRQNSCPLCRRVPYEEDHA